MRGLMADECIADFTIVNVLRTLHYLTTMETLASPRVHYHQIMESSSGINYITSAESLCR